MEERGGLRIRIPEGHIERLQSCAPLVGRVYSHVTLRGCGSHIEIPLFEYTSMKNDVLAREVFKAWVEEDGAIEVHLEYAFSE